MNQLVKTFAAAYLIVVFFGSLVCCKEETEIVTNNDYNCSGISVLYAY